VSGIALSGKGTHGRGRPTTLEFKAEMLSELWLSYRYESKFVDFGAFNDLGLPLAYAFSEGIVSSSP
jgi:hypothetical protein